MRYTLRQLEVFLAVARDESVSHAARELAMSQSAVSSSLADLEGQFDIALFERIGKRLKLSALGHAVRARATALHDQALELERAFEGRSEVGTVRVGATLTIGNYLAAALIARFMRAHPSARVTLDVANTAEIARKLSNFEIDVGLVEGEVSLPALEATPFRDDELVVFCAPSHPLAAKRVLCDDDLLGATWVAREVGSGTRQAFDRAMRDVLPRLRIVLELQHTEALKSAVEAGLGLGCVSRIALEEPFRLGTLVPCRVPHRDFTRKLYVVSREARERAAGTQRFVEICTEGEGGA